MIRIHKAFVLMMGGMMLVGITMHGTDRLRTITNAGYAPILVSFTSKAVENEERSKPMHYRRINNDTFCHNGAEGRAWQVQPGDTVYVPTQCSTNGVIVTQVSGAGLYPSAVLKFIDQDNITITVDGSNQVTITNNRNQIIDSKVLQ